MSIIVAPRGVTSQPLPGRSTLSCEVREPAQGHCACIGLPKTVAGVTINRYCASGITAVAMTSDIMGIGPKEAIPVGSN